MFVEFKASLFEFVYVKRSFFNFITSPMRKSCDLATLFHKPDAIIDNLLWHGNAKFILQAVFKYICAESLLRCF